ncbi:hypothetical protein ACF0H5_005127 [Mactra antiquata]
MITGPLWGLIESVPNSLSFSLIEHTQQLQLCLEEWSKDASSVLGVFSEEDASINRDEIPGFPDWFNVIYKNDPDIYSAKLAEDLKIGDLVVKA